MASKESSQVSGKPHVDRRLHRSVAEALRRRVAEGSLSAGAKLPALAQLAEEYRVSTMTVRQAIHILEGEGRLYRIPGVGAFVRPSPPALAAASKITVAFAALDLGSAFDMGIARGIENACQVRGWGVQIFDAKSDPEVEARNLARLGDSVLQGAIVLPLCYHDDLEAMFRLKLSGFPVVLVDRSVPGLRADRVHSDHQKAAYLATEHLLRKGHRCVLIVTEKPLVSSVADRLHGYEQALADQAVEPLREWKLWIDAAVMCRGVQEDRRWLGGYSAVLPALKAMQTPLAVFAHNDYSAWGVYEACRELRLRIPEDVSVVCCDDSDIVRAMSAPLTAVAQRTFEIGRIAVELLARRLQNRDPDAEPQRVLVDVDLVERESVAAITDPRGGPPPSANRSSRDSMT